MKKEDIYNAISDISLDILEDVETYKGGQRKRKAVYLKRWAVAAACAVLLLGLLSVLPGKESRSPFTVTAYALEMGNELVGTSFKVGQEIPVKGFRLSTGTEYFLFSVDLKDKNDLSRISAFAFESLSTAEKEEIIHKYGEDRGKFYFYFVPSENMKKDVIWIDIPLDNINADFSIRFTNRNDGFTAQLLKTKH